MDKIAKNYNYFAVYHRAFKSMQYNKLRLAHLLSQYRYCCYAREYLLLHSNNREIT